MVKNIWKSYIWTADKEVNESDPCSNVHYLGSSENKAWKKIQACTGFEPMTSAILSSAHYCEDHFHSGNFYVKVIPLFCSVHPVMHIKIM